MLKNKLILALVIVGPFLVALALTVYLLGLRKYGSPDEYRAGQMEMMQAREDSLQALQPMESTENIADSTLIGMTAETRIRDELLGREADIRAIQSSLDSLDRVRAEIATREASVAAREEQLAREAEAARSADMQKLATLYDNMRTAMAVPIFLRMDDSLAVDIIDLMDEENAADLLGALAEADVEKAARLNELMAR